MSDSRPMRGWFGKRRRAEPRAWRSRNSKSWRRRCKLLTKRDPEAAYPADKYPGWYW